MPNSKSQRKSKREGVNVYLKKKIIPENFPNLKKETVRYRKNRGPQTGGLQTHTNTYN